MAGITSGIAGRLTNADLATLPPPDAVETLDYEAILSECKANLQQLEPGLDVEALPESDPVIKILEVLAYRELHVRQRLNESIRSCLLATARGPGLQHLASLLSGRTEFGAVEDLRDVVLSEYERVHTAGSRAAYEHLARETGGGDVTDVSVHHADDTPGVITVTLLGPHGQALADPVVARIQDKLNRDDVRPIAHCVTVQPANITPYQVKARLGIVKAPGGNEALAGARSAVRQYVDRQYRLGHSIDSLALRAALCKTGVRYVLLEDTLLPGSSTAHDKAYFCNRIDIAINTKPPDEKVQILGIDGSRLRVRAPRHESRLTHYAVYYADNDGHKLGLSGFPNKTRGSSGVCRG